MHPQTENEPRIAAANCSPKRWSTLDARRMTLIGGLPTHTDGENPAGTSYMYRALHNSVLDLTGWLAEQVHQEQEEAGIG
jgi:hypothetical protein